MMTMHRLAVVGVCLGSWLGSFQVGLGQDHGKARHGEQALPNCPVMDEPIDLSVSLATDDGPVFFCCQGCIEKYQAAPAKYAAR